MAVDRLMANSFLRDELVRSEEVRKGLVVFVRSQSVWSAYEKLRTEKSFADPDLAEKPSSWVLQQPEKEKSSEMKLYKIRVTAEVLETAHETRASTWTATC